MTVTIMRHVLETWMENVVARDCASLYEDLHIDRIDPALVESRTWLSGAIRCVELAAEIRDDHQWDVIVAASFSLTSNPERTGINFTSMAEVEMQMDWSPPSIYVFQRGSEPWSTAECEELGHAMQIVAGSRQIRSFLCEWFDSNDADYRRSLWLVL